MEKDLLIKKELEEGILRWKEKAVENKIATCDTWEDLFTSVEIVLDDYNKFIESLNKYYSELEEEF